MRGQLHSLIAKARVTVAPRSPKPAAEGSTPSGPANAPGIQFGHQHLDNRIGNIVVVGTGATTGSDDHGSGAPWGAAVRLYLLLMAAVD
jgi:hypothetical protein